MPMESLRGTAASIGAGPPAWARDVLPGRRSLPMEHLCGTTAPIGARPRAGSTGSPAKAAVIAYGAPADEGSC